MMALTAMTLGANAQQKMYLTIGGVTKSATLVSNSSTEALMAQLQQGIITYEAHDYGNFEKAGPLGYTFPSNDEDITTQPGDLILYQGSNLCIYYDTNSWDFTRIGKLDNMTQADIKPPKFIIFVNDPELMHFSYLRFIENRLREMYGFEGTPIRLIVRARDEEEDY